MKKSSLCALFTVALAGAVITVAVRQNAIGRIRAENQTLLDESQEAQTLTQENQELARLRTENEEVKKLRSENQDLPRLRNEVRQLRRQAEVLAGLRAENQRLLAQSQNAGDNGVSTLTPPNFIPKSALFDAGLATPEATLQTYFWAATQGNIDRVGQCLLEGAANLYRNKEWVLRRLADEMSHFTGFAITDKTDISPDEVEVSLQSTVGGTVLKKKLRRVDNDWKIDSEPIM